MKIAPRDSVLNSRHLPDVHHAVGFLDDEEVIVLRRIHGKVTITPSEEPPDDSRFEEFADYVASASKRWTKPPCRALVYQIEQDTVADIYITHDDGSEWIDRDILTSLIEPFGFATLEEITRGKFSAVVLDLPAEETIIIPVHERLHQQRRVIAKSEGRYASHDTSEQG